MAKCYTCGKPGHLARGCWGNNIRQVARDPAHSSSGGGSVTTHTAAQQQATVTQQSSSAETKPVVRRVENNEPTIFDLRERHDDSESHRIRVIHFHIGDDDDEPWKGGENLFEDSFEEVEQNEKPKARRLGEERDDVFIIIDSGADVA